MYRVTKPTEGRAAESPLCRRLSRPALLLLTSTVISIEHASPVLDHIPVEQILLLCSFHVAEAAAVGSTSAAAAAATSADVLAFGPDFAQSGLSGGEAGLLAGATPTPATHCKWRPHFSTEKISLV